MKHVLTGSVVLIDLVILTVILCSQSHGFESRHQVRPSDASGKLRSSGIPQRASSTDGLSFSPSKSHIPPRSPDLGSPTFPLSPSIGPGSGLLGPESGRSPTRLRTGIETGRGEAANERDE